MAVQPGLCQTWSETKDRFSYDTAHIMLSKNDATVMTPSLQTDRSGQTVQTENRLLLEEQSDQGLHCLLFHLHLFDEIPLGLASLFE